MLDIAANSGVIGLLCFIGLIAVSVLQLRRTPESAESELAESHLRPTQRSDVISPRAATAIVASMLLVVGWIAGTENSLHWHVIVAGILAASLAPLFTKTLTQCDRGFCCTTVSVVAALLIHLLAAGGIGMPAILLLLLVFVTTSHTDHGISETSDSNRVPFGVSILLVTAFAACVQTSLVPVISSTTHIADGDFASISAGQIDDAKASYIRAAEADPLSPEPLLRLSHLSFSLWEQTDETTYFEHGVDFAIDAAKASPYSGIPYFLLGKRFRQRYHRTHNPDDARASYHALQKSLEAYPTQPFWNAEYALVLNDTKDFDAARQAARRTLTLDEINHRAGHLDRYLPEETVASIKRLADSTVNSRN